MTPPVSSALWFRASYPLRSFLRGFRSWDSINAWREQRGMTHDDVVQQIAWLEECGAAFGDENGWALTGRLPWVPDWLVVEAGASQEPLVDIGKPIVVEPKTEARQGAIAAQRCRNIHSVSPGMDQSQTGMGW